MRYIIACLICVFSYATYAGGGIVHMYIAEESISYLHDSKLRNLLYDNLDAYLVGAHYPDSGYVPGTGYGEDSHWDLFIDTFAEYIMQKYPDLELQNPKLIAFLFGCATHRLSDEIIHSIFYKEVAAHDFRGDAEKAHTYGDVGIDLLLNIDKSRWNNHPKVWWVPVRDLLEIYHRMGKDQYTEDEIIYGNSVLNAAGYAERAVSIESYPYLRLRMPWTSKHYYDWPVGGILMDIKAVADYQNVLWQRLKATTKRKTWVVTQNTKKNHSPTVFMQCVKSLIDNNIVKSNVIHYVDGSVELQAWNEQHKISCQLSLISGMTDKLN